MGPPPKGGGIRSPKKSALLAQQIVSEIVSNGLGAGDRLAPEAEMGATYGVGRSTIREALRVLESQGVVKIKTGPGGGPVVAPFDASFLATNIGLHLQLSGATFGDVMRARLVIEPSIAAAAASLGAGPALDALREVIEHSHDATNSVRLVAESANFHDLVAASSANPFFEYLLLALHRITEPFAQRLPYIGERRERLIRHHEQIIRAIESGDDQAAAAAMKEDILEFFDYAEQEAPHLLEEPIEWGNI
jgi:GntR family transcriptional repressor for pyruvate dehydrogenase complex